MSQTTTESTPTTLDQPKLGERVYYTSRGSADGEFTPEARIALVTEVAPFDDHVSLQVVTPDGAMYQHDVPGAQEPTPGCWHWPATPLR